MQIVHTDAGKRRSLRSPGRLRRVATMGGSLVGAAIIAAGFALPAGATIVPPANNTLIGSGSSTTYSMMQILDPLFSSAPGCQQFVPFPSASALQPLDYSCVAEPTPAANPENPFNDVAVEEPALGSSNGIRQLEDSGAHGSTSPSGGSSIGNVANNANYARSSRAAGSTDLEGLNFAAYAEDGVSWFHFTKYASVASPSANLTNLTQTELVDIYNGTFSNWDQVCNGGLVANGCGANAPIVVFSAQEGSGTQSTFKTFLGFDPSAATNQVNCFTSTKPGSSKVCDGPGVIFENEDAQMVPTAFAGSQAPFVQHFNPDWGGTNATLPDIRSDAIFFFSTGKYNLSCKPLKGTHCGGVGLGTTAANAVGSIGGVAPTQTNILDGAFPDSRFLYNVYSDGSNANIPAATAATLNYVSEVGFLCNPNKGSGTAVLDPNTGVAYENEIQSDIEASGFYPLSGAASSGGIDQTPIDEGTVPNPASRLLDLTTGGGQAPGQPNTDPGYAQYKPFDLFATTGPSSDPAGYCLTSSTDANASS
jgi:ABC-type phosphate transport system substrate-binding protein